MKDIRSYWFGGSHFQIGIIVGEDAITGAKKGYIGTCSGVDPNIDTEFIAAHGSPVSWVILDEISNYLKSSTRRPNNEQSRKT